MKLFNVLGRTSNNLLKHRLSASVSSSGQVATVHSESFGQSITYFMAYSSSLQTLVDTQTLNSYRNNALTIQNLRNKDRFTTDEISDRKNKSIMVSTFNAPRWIF